MSGLIEMGGYAAFVWPSYGLSAAVLIGVLIASLRQRRIQRETLERLEGAATTGQIIDEA